MIYNLILLGTEEGFARVKIIGEVHPGHNIRFKNHLFRVSDIKLGDIYVTL